MNPLPEIVAGATAFTVLTIDGQPLLLPQVDVEILELRADMTAPENPQNALIGTIGFQQRQWPVYCLSGPDLVLTGTAPQSRYICALLHHSQGYQGLLCDHVETITGESLSVHPLPQCMQTQHSVVSALARRDDAVLPISTALQLEDFLSRQLGESP